jgi:fructoselysine-6-P-deglycase FrlB-like protein
MSVTETVNKSMSTWKKIMLSGAGFGAGFALMLAITVVKET